jgi:osmotically-inducible protein OsmY
MRLLTLAAVAVLAAGIYHYRQRRGPGARRAPARDVSDYRMEQAVRTAVAGKASGAIDVRCINGIVTLRGTLGGAERDRVLAAALAVPGVRQVTNLLDVTDPLGDLGPMQSGIATGV